jgi:hypothetical protein
MSEARGHLKNKDSKFFERLRRIVSALETAELKRIQAPGHDAALTCVKPPHNHRVAVLR